MEQKLIENGFNLFKPVLENGKIDLIAEKDNVYIKLQIKTIQVEKDGRKIIPVRKISHNMGEYKVKLYTKEDIDYFIGVDLDAKDLYILPVDFSTKYKSSISINSCVDYKNNFKQMEPISGNINSGHDDNVEALTGNADGTDVGIEGILAARE